MELQQISLSVPAMYADHHVVQVRRLVAALPGVIEVVASAAQAQITVKLDPAKLSADEITSVLVAGGYPPGKAGGGPAVTLSPDALRHVRAADQGELVPDAKYHPPPTFGACPGLEPRVIAGEHPADRN